MDEVSSSFVGGESDRSPSIIYHKIKILIEKGNSNLPIDGS
jgi:hypothetical protein